MIKLIRVEVDKDITAMKRLRNFIFQKPISRKMHEILQKNPNFEVLFLYEKYRTTFCAKFYIAFGYSRSAICSNRDAYIAEMNFLRAKFSENLDVDMNK